MPESLLGLTVREILLAAAALAVVIVVLGLIHLAWKRIVRRLIAKTGTTLAIVVADAVEGPLHVGIALASLYFLAAYLPLTERADDIVARTAYPIFTLVMVYAVGSVVDRLLKWYGEEIAPKTAAGIDDKFVPLLRRAIAPLALIMGVMLGLEQTGLEVPSLREWLADHGPRLVIILAIIFVLPMFLSHVLPPFVKRSVARGGGLEGEIAKRADTLSVVLVTTGQVVVMVVGVFMLLSEMRINITPILTGVGVVGLAVGFGAQSLVKDVIAGLFIILENQYRVGDVARVADISGLVEEINLRRTVLRDLDGIVHVVPNGEIKVASNFTKEWSRVNLNIEVSYGTDLDHAIAVINRVGNELALEPEWAPAIIKAPQALRVDKLGASGIEIKILGDTQPIRQWDVMGELRKRLKNAFDEEGIEIPWPHTKVYFGNSPPAPGGG